MSCNGGIDITGYDQDIHLAAKTVVSLDITETKKAERVRLGDTFQRTAHVTFETINNAQIYALDVDEVRISGRKPCEDNPDEVYRYLS